MALSPVFKYLVSLWKRIYLCGGKLCLYADVAGKVNVSESDGAAFIPLAAFSGTGGNGRRRVGDAVCFDFMYGIYYKYRYFYGADSAYLCGSNSRGTEEKADVAFANWRMHGTECFFRTFVPVLKMSAANK